MAKREPHPTLKIELASAALAAAFERLVSRAARNHISVVVDADAMAIKLVPAALNGSNDLRNAVMDTIRVHNACGSTAAKVSGNACSYGNL